MEFRPMRRHLQQLSPEECTAVLLRQSAGVLAVLGDGGYPYAVPLSYVYAGGRLYFHGAPSGHKLDALRACDKVSFCVTDLDQIVPEEYTTYFRSVIAFGRARVLEKEDEKRAALSLLGEKYSPGVPGLAQTVEQSLARVSIVELAIEHLTGKEGRELAEQRRAEEAKG